MKSPVVKSKQFNDFLSDEGRLIYDRIMEHCVSNGISNKIDEFELSMLANSFDQYAKNAEYCKVSGSTQAPEKGGWDQVRPEYTIMKNEYQNVIKHSAKFGLNPGDRARIFSHLKEKDKDEGFDLSMKIAK